MNNKMKKQNISLNIQENENDYILHKNNSYYDDKPLTDIEYLHYISKKTKSTNTIVYPDGSKGELNKAVVVLL